MLRILFAVLCMWYARCFLLLLCCMFYVHTFDTLPIWAHTIRAYNIFTLLRRIVMIFGFVGCSWFSFVFLLFSLLFSRSSQREYVLSPLRLLLWDANSSFEQRNVLYFCVCFLCLDNFLFLFALFDRSMSKQRKHPPNVFIFIIHSTVFISVPTLIPPQPKKKNIHQTNLWLIYFHCVCFGVLCMFIVHFRLLKNQVENRESRFHFVN